MAAPPPSPPPAPEILVAKGPLSIFAKAAAKIGSSSKESKNRTVAKSVSKRSTYVKESGKTISKDSLETRNVEADELREKLRKSESELEISLQTNNELCESLESLSRKMQKLERKNQELRSSNDCLLNEAQTFSDLCDEEAKAKEASTHEIQALKDCKASTERDLVELQKKYAVQCKELRSCRDDLFSLQPVVQLTDSEIMNQYDNLCQQISN